MMEFSPQQADALEAAHYWLNNGTKQVFKLFGYAGTGKTTLARTIGQMAGRTLFAAYTGKAAQVLTSKGCPATTLHSLLYIPNGEGKDKNGKKQPRFILNPDSELMMADLLVVDEVSMVNAELATDILGFGVPVLVLGDPAQLPPVEGGGYFTDGTPDILLTEVHRHDNEVLELATTIREGGRYSRAKTVTWGQAGMFDQVIVGKNTTRWMVNEQLREAAGLEGLPKPGDKVICLQNDHDAGVMNGQTFVTLDWNDERKMIRVADDYGAERFLNVWPQGFTQQGENAMKDWDYYTIKQRVHMTFAWAITCHKSQGSQWGSVLVADEGAVFREMAQRWRYTAVTRAVDEVVIVNPSGIRSPEVRMPASVRRRLGR
jgi:exodeoxyribonuclease-5